MKKYSARDGETVAGPVYCQLWLVACLQKNIRIYTPVRPAVPCNFSRRLYSRIIVLRTCPRLPIRLFGRIIMLRQCQPLPHARDAGEHQWIMLD